MIELKYTPGEGGSTIFEEKEKAEKILSEKRYTTKHTTADTVQFYFGDEPAELVPPDVQQTPSSPAVDVIEIINNMTPETLLLLKTKLDQLT